MKRKHGVFDLLSAALMIIIIILMIYPFYYMFIYSISDPLEASKGVFLLPRGMTLVNYALVIQIPAIALGFAISISRTVLGTIITIFCSSAFAYLLTKDDLPFRRIIYRFLVVTMYLSSGLIPWFLTMVAYGLRNKFLLYIIPGAIGAFTVVLIRTYIIESIPPSLDESAVIDGASIIIVFLKIILPLSLPILTAMAVFAAVGQWNAWTDNLFLVNDPKLKTLQLLLYEMLISKTPTANENTRQIIETMGREPTPTSLKMTVSVITILPVFMIYPFLQKYFITGLMIGAIKG